MLFYCSILEHAPPKTKRNSIITVPSYKFVNDCICVHDSMLYRCMFWKGTRVCPGDAHEFKETKQDLFCLLLSFCYGRSEGYIGSGSEQIGSLLLRSLDNIHPIEREQTQMPKAAHRLEEAVVHGQKLSFSLWGKILQIHSQNLEYWPKPEDASKIRSKIKNLNTSRSWQIM